MILDKIESEIGEGKISETCLYDSSNVLQSYYDEKDQDLYITFLRGGSVYVYKKVSFEDYVWFREHPSQGKTLRGRLSNYKYEVSNVLEGSELKLLVEKQAKLMKK